MNAGNLPGNHRLKFHVAGEEADIFGGQVSLNPAGAKVGLIGTNRNMIGDRELPAHRTTPDSWELQALLRQMAEDGCQPLSARGRAPPGPAGTKRRRRPAPELQALLRQMADEGCTHVVMEISSHALVQRRAAGRWPSVLSPDRATKSAPGVRVRVSLDMEEISISKLRIPPTFLAGRGIP